MREPRDPLLKVLFLVFDSDIKTDLSIKLAPESAKARFASTGLQG